MTKRTLLAALSASILSNCVDAPPADTGAARRAELARVAFSGSYEDLGGRPELSTYATVASLATVATTGRYSDLVGAPDAENLVARSSLAPVATSGSYADLVDAPDPGAYATRASLSSVATTGRYADLVDAPDPGAYATRASLSSVATTGRYADLLDAPDLGAFATRQSLAGVATSGRYADLLQAPDLSVYATRASLSPVATSGRYADLAGLPDLGAYPQKASLAPVALSGSYLDLADRPRASSHLDARAFGARGDALAADGGLLAGSADDTAALQAALDAAASAPSRTVHLPAGGYRLTASLRVPAGVRLVGDGSASVLMRDPSVPPFDLVVVDAVAGVAIERLKVDGVRLENRAVPANRFAGIRIRRSSTSLPRPSDVVVRDVECTRTTSGEIQAEGIRGCLVAEDSVRVAFDRIHGHGNVGTAILIVGGEHASVTHSRLHDNTFGSGISGNSYSHLLVSGNQAWANGYTNISVNGVRSVITGNISYGSTYAGITIGHNNDASRADDTVCTGNSVSGNQLGGIYVSNSERVLVANNRIVGNAQAGIRFSWQEGAGAEGGVVVRGNVIADNAGSGVLVQWGSRHVLEGNVISGNTGSGIYMDGGSVASPLPVGRSVLRGNTLRDNGSGTWSGGIVFVAAEGVCIGNFFEKPAGAATAGIVASQAASRVLVAGNLFDEAFPAADMFRKSAGGTFVNLATPPAP